MHRQLYSLLTAFLLLLLGAQGAAAQYDPANPSDPGQAVVTQYSTVTLKARPAEGGTVSPSTPTRYVVGSSNRVQATAAKNFRFDHWEDADGNLLSRDYYFYYATPAQDATIYAVFEPVPYDPANPSDPGHVAVTKYWSLVLKTSHPGSCTLRPSTQGSYTEGQRINVYYSNKASYYTFVNWTDSQGNVVSTSSDFYYYMPGHDETLTANFTFDFNPGNPSDPGHQGRDHTLYLTANPAKGGSFSTYSTTTQREGTSVSVTANPSTYYYFISWTDMEGNVLSTSRTYSFTMPDSDVRLTANFGVNYDPNNPSDPSQPDVVNPIDPDKVWGPRFSMEGDHTVIIFCETPDAEIHYTMDGSEPTRTSPLYTAPITVESNVKVGAIAFKEGMKDSQITWYQVSGYRCVDPSIKFISGRRLQMTCETEGAQIWYTLDFTDPNPAKGIGTLYTEPITPSGDVRIKAIATLEGYGDSFIVPYSHRQVEHQTQMPVITMDERTNLVTITTPDEGARLYYTIDGETPTEEMEVHESGVNFTVETNLTVKALAVTDDLYPSFISEYAIGSIAAAAPVIDFTDLTVRITNLANGGKIMYTTDGSEPSETNGTEYTAPFLPAGDCTVKAVCIKEGNLPSAITEYEYTVADHKVAKPTFTLDGSTYKVSTATDGAVIYWVEGDGTPIVGNDQPADGATRYENGITVSRNGRLTVQAMADGMLASDTTTIVVSHLRTAAPAISFANRQVRITPAKAEGQSIRYTTDGSEPTATSGTLYRGPFTPASACTVKAICLEEGFNPSAVTEFAYDPKDLTTATPAISREGNALSISCPTEGARIYWMYGEGEPITADHIIADGAVLYTGPITLTHNVTVTAQAMTDDFFRSATESFTADDFATDAPAITFSRRNINIGGAKEGAAIRYTTDGSEPSATNGTLYEGPFLPASACTVKAICLEEGFNPSAVTEFAYDPKNHTTATPTFSREGNTLSISCPTEGARIYWMYGNGEPITADHTIADGATLYTGPITLTHNVTITAQAMTDDLFRSAVTEPFDVTDFNAPGIHIEFADRKINIVKDAISGARAVDEIRYTLDGTVPTETTGERYTAPFLPDHDCTVIAGYFTDGFNPFITEPFVYNRKDRQVATPTIQRDGNSLVMTTATDGAEIWFVEGEGTPLVDDDTPSANAIRYTGPIALTRNGVYTAQAMAPNRFMSEVSETHTVDDFATDAPAISFAGRAIHMTPAKAEGQSIRYTTDGTDPTAENGTLYAGPFTPASACTVKAISIEEGFNPSAVTEFTYDPQNHTTETPTFTRSGNALSITCPTEGARIYWMYGEGEPITADHTAAEGATPYTGPIALTRNVTVTAQAMTDDLFRSAAATIPVNDFGTEAPAISFSNRQVSIRSTKTDASNVTIRYTLGGVDPSETNGIVYDGPFIPEEDCVIKAICLEEGFNPSPVVEFPFVLADVTASDPVFTREGNTLTLTSDTPGAQVYWIHGEGAPINEDHTLANGATLYSTPIELTHNGVYTAQAMTPDFFRSNPVTHRVTDFDAPGLDIVFADRLINIVKENASMEGSIRYTLDGNVPTDATGTLYSGPFLPTEDCTVTAVFFTDDFNPSQPATYDYVRGNLTVETPVFSREGNTLTISTPTAGAEIWYVEGTGTPLVDDDTPAANAIRYTGPIALTRNGVFTAQAMAPNRFMSETESIAIDDFKTDSPAITFEGYLIHMEAPKANTRIRYTLDGSDPSAENGLDYTRPFLPREDCRIMAVCLEEGFNQSAATVYDWILADHRAAMPTITREGNTITLSCETPGARIHWYGGDPIDFTTLSPEMLEGMTEERLQQLLNSSLYRGPIQVTRNMTVYAAAITDELLPSDPAIEEVNDLAADMPEISFSRRQIHISAKEGAQIRYTTDGSEPSVTNGLEYTGPFTLTDDCTVRAVSIEEGVNPSAAAEFGFIVADHTTKTPAFSREGNALSISCPTEGARIYWMYGNGEPITADHTIADGATLYTGPITLTHNVTITAQAMNDDLFRSAVTEPFDVTDFDAPGIHIEFADRKINIVKDGVSGARAADEIRYTLDGTVPTETTGERYTAPFLPDHDCTIIAGYFNDGFNPFITEPFDYRKGEWTVETPVFSREGNALSISTATDGAEIWYLEGSGTPLVDDDTPAQNAIRYTGPIALTRNGVYTAQAMAPNRFKSELSETYPVNDFATDAPAISFAGRAIHITPAKAEGQSIRYTTDGSEPTATSGTLYTGPFTPASACTVKAISIEEGFNPSAVTEFTFDPKNYTTDTPTFSREGNALSISCPTEGARIYWMYGVGEPITADHTIANGATLYTGPITLTHNVTITAQAMNDDLFRSAVTEPFDVTDFDAPGIHIEFADRKINIVKDGVSGARAVDEIRYTLDGTVPTETTGERYTAPFLPDHDCTIIAGYFNDGFNPFITEPFDYRKGDWTVKTPKLTREGNTLVMATETDGAEIWFVEGEGAPLVDDDTPTANAIRYTGPIALTRNGVYTAQAMAPNMFKSEVSETHAVNDFATDAPAISFAGRAIHITPAKAEGQSIRYTTDGSEPTATSGTLYTGPFTPASACTVKAICIEEGFNPSAVAEFTFDPKNYTTETPAFSREGNALSISCPTEDARIYWMYGVGEPITEDHTIANGATLYTGPITLTHNVTITAQAMNDDLFRSDTASHDVTDFDAPGIHIEFADRKINIVKDGVSGARAADEIRYTTDDNVVLTLETGTLYTGPFLPDDDCTIRAAYFTEGFNPFYTDPFPYNREDWQVKTPKITREGNSLVMATATDGAEIWYLEGSGTPLVDDDTPAANAIRYTGPIALTRNGVYTAQAMAPNMFMSEVSETHHVNDFATDAPAITFEGYLIHMEAPKANTRIRYTLDNSDPSAENGLDYTRPFLPREDCRIKAVCLEEGFNQSAATVYDWILADHRAAMPTITREGNTITLSCETPGSRIHWYGGDPIDFSTLTPEMLEGMTEERLQQLLNSSLYRGPIQVTRNMTVYAAAITDELLPSDPAIEEVNDLAADMPEISFSRRQIHISAKEGAQIRYTTDDSEPSATNGLEYTGPFTLTDDCTVRAVSIEYGVNPSAVAEFDFIVADHTTKTPAFSREGNALSISCPTEDARIYWMYGVGEPITEEHTIANGATLYTGPITLTHNVTITAQAMTDDLFRSATASHDVTDFDAPGIHIEFADRKINIVKDGVSGARAVDEIRYTTDDNVVLTRETGTLYTGPFLPDDDCTIRAAYFTEGFNPFYTDPFPYNMKDWQVETPSIQRDGNTLVMATATDGAEIWFVEGEGPSLVDDDTPAQNAIQYTGPITLTRNGVYTAQAMAPNRFKSELSETHRVDDFDTEAPVISFSKRNIHIDGAKEGARIRYTLDGKEPTADYGTDYTGPFLPEKDCTIRAVALEEGFNPALSEEHPFVREDVTTKTPTLRLDGSSVVIECETPDASIYWIEGTAAPVNADYTPAQGAALYTAPIQMTRNGTYTAMAMTDDLLLSKAETRPFDPFTTDAPEIFFAKRQINIRSTKANADGVSIRYTTDDSNPTATSGNLYEGPFTPTNECTVKAICIKEGFNPSVVIPFEYDPDRFKTETPAFSREGNALSISCPTEDARIYWMYGVGEPITEDHTIANGATLYTGPITLTHNVTITAQAMNDDLFRSATASHDVTDFDAPGIHIEFADRKINIVKDGVSGARAVDEIRYTTEDNVVLTRETGTLYTGPFLPDHDCTIRAAYFTEGFNPFFTVPFVYRKGDWTVATPTIQRDGNTLVMATATDGAEIWYLEGSGTPLVDDDTPAQNAIRYTGPITLTRNGVYTAQAMAPNRFKSELSETHRVDDFDTEAPVISFSKRNIHIDGAKEGARIRYTLDGKEPTEDYGTDYTGPFLPEKDCTIRAVALEEGFNPALSEEYPFVLEDVTTKTPTLRLDGSSVVIECETPDATIYWIEGTAAPVNADYTPAQGAALYTAPIQMTRNGVYTAMAFTEDLLLSKAETSPFDPFTTDAPEIFFAKRQINIRSTKANADGVSIRYTLNGDDPTAESGILYEGPFTPTNECTVKAICIEEGFNPSAVIPFEYDPDRFKTETPTFSREDNALSISCPTEDARIYWMYGSGEPITEDHTIANGATLYTGPITLTHNVTVTAQAMNDDLFRSATASHDVTDFDTEAPVISFSKRNIHIDGAKEGARIRYTLDGKEPTEDYGTDYTGPFLPEKDCTIRAVALEEGFNPALSEEHPFVLEDVTTKTPTLRLDGSSVVIECETPDATIYWIEGTAAPVNADYTPAHGAALYTAPIQMTRNGTYTAMAMTDDLLLSKAETSPFDPFTTDAPEIFFAKRQINIRSTKANADGVSIRYTTDDSDPTATSGNLYEGPFTLTTACTVKAICIEEGFNPSVVIPFEYDPDRFKTETPAFSREGNALSISCPTEDARIYWIYGSGEPITEDHTIANGATLYTGPITLTHNVTITTQAMTDDLFRSATASHDVTDFDAPGIHIEFADRKINIVKDGVSGARAVDEIRYIIIDNEDVELTRETGTLYTGPFLPDHDCIIRAAYFTEGFNPFFTEPFVYRKGDWTVATPTIQRDGNTLVMATATDGAEIWYLEGSGTPLVDDDTPTANAIRYTGPITLTRNGVYTAQAMATNRFMSKKDSIPVTHFVTDNPEIFFTKRQINIRSTKANADGVSIRYTTDDSDPTETSGTLYEGPFLPKAKCTVKAICIEEDFNPSTVVKFDYDPLDHTVATPTLRLDGSSVVIECETPDASIYWIEGTAAPVNADYTPAQGAALYTAPIQMTRNGTYTAMAMTDDLLLSKAETRPFDPFTTDAPEIFFAKRQINIRSTKANADGVSIRYTTDDSDPTATSGILYEGPFTLTTACTVKAICIEEGFNPSAVIPFEYDPDRFKTETPAFSREGNALSISCPTEDARIYWMYGSGEPITEDHTIANGATLYTGPITLTHNVTITAQAMNDDLFRSATESFTADDFDAPGIHIEFADRKINIVKDGVSGARAVDEIRYIIYNKDEDVELTRETGTLYTEPFLPDHDCIIKAAYFTDGFNPFFTEPFPYNREDWTVKTPKLTREGNTLVMATATDGAEIWYLEGSGTPLVDDDTPTANAIRYTGPITLTRNGVYTAQAMATNRFMSETESTSVDDFTAPSPTIGFAKKNVFVTFDDADARTGDRIIVSLLSLDGKDIIEQERHYDGPFLPAADCIVAARTAREDWNTSEPSTYTFIREEHTVPQLTVEPRHWEGTFILNAATAGETLLPGETVKAGFNAEPTAIFNGNDQMNETLFQADAEGLFTAMWESDERLEREPLAMEVRLAEAPTFSYDGRTLNVDTHGNLWEGAATYHNGDSRDLYSTTEELDWTGDVTGFCWNSEAGLFRSTIAQFPINAFHNGDDKAILAEGGCLSQAFGWKKSLDDITSLTVEGPVSETPAPLTAEDLKVIDGMRSLVTLDLRNAETAGVSGISLGSLKELLEISLPRTNASEAGWDFSDNPMLSAIRWNEANTMPEAVAASVANPNLLVFAEDRKHVSSARNVIVKGEAESLTLTQGHHFHTPEEFTAKRAEFTKAFGKTTIPGLSSGWETIVLPFDVDEIRHLDKDEAISPFGSEDGLKHFWLTEIEDRTMQAATSIQAGKPYMISMPNSELYLDEYNLAGNVKFIGHDVTVTTEDPEPAPFTKENGKERSFNGTYWPIERGPRVFALAESETGESFFDGGAADVAPFECWFDGEEGMKRIAIGNGLSDVQQIISDAFRAEVEYGDGAITILSRFDAVIPVYTMDGYVVRRIEAKANEPVMIKDLSQGIYIVCGKKIRL